LIKYSYQQLVLEIDERIFDKIPYPCRTAELNKTNIVWDMMTKTGK